MELAVSVRNNYCDESMYSVYIYIYIGGEMSFLCASLKNWEESGDKARHIVPRVCYH